MFYRITARIDSIGYYRRSWNHASYASATLFASYLLSKGHGKIYDSVTITPIGYTI